MSNPNPERDERVKQIRERRNALQLRHGDWPCQTVHNSRERAFQQYVLADIDYLLSLYDSQAAEMIALRKEVAASERYQTLLLDQPDATRMRDRCVEKVRELCDKWREDIDAAAYSTMMKTQAADEIREALEKLEPESDASD